LRALRLLLELLESLVLLNLVLLNLVLLVSIF
jgi:hypothetical protein